MNACNRWLLPCLAALLLATTPTLAAAPAQGTTPKACPGRGTAEARLEAARAWEAKGGRDKAAYCVAVALFDLERYAEAAKAFAALAERPNYTPSLRAQLMSAAAQGWLLAGDDGKAVDLLTAAIALRPADANLWIDRGRAHADKGNWDAALADLDKAVSLAPEQADARVFRASTRRRLADLSGAADDLDVALTLDPADPEAFLERGLLRLATGDAAGAAQDWRTVGIIAPESEAARLAYKNLEALNKPAGR